MSNIEVGKAFQKNSGQPAQETSDGGADPVITAQGAFDIGRMLEAMMLDPACDKKTNA